MSLLKLEHARTIVRVALETGRANNFKPLAVTVLDSGGHLKAFEREDDTSVMRFQIAQGKAFGAIGLGIGSRAIFQRAQEQAFFVSAVNTLAGGSLVPVPGGVLIKTDAGKIIGAVGISGDNSDNDEICAIAGIEATEFVADPG